MAHLRTYQTRTVAWGFGASFVGIDPLEANWVVQWSPRTPPCPQIRYFLLTGIFDFTWVQWSSLDIVLCFPPLMRFFTCNRKDVQNWQRRADASGSEVPATRKSDCYSWDIALMIVWSTVDEWVNEVSACATHPEFVSHLVSVFTPWGTLGPNKLLSVTVWNVSGNLFMKSTIVVCSKLSAKCECA